ncbi:MAG: helix-turn-helix transcriptional regulator [Chitinophagaceae bacterium]|nr:helix-turn-helix transcriptional regulator [Chitinophagaceae bacterium]
MSESIHHGTSLRYLRLLSGMKQEIFARKMGVKQQQISKWEKQETIPRSRLEQAAEILKVPVDVFEKFDERGLLKLAAGAKLEDVAPSVKNVVKYFTEELVKKDKQIEELKFELNEYKIAKTENQ